MDVAHVVPIQVAMSTPSQSEETEAPTPVVNPEDPADSDLVDSDPATPPAEPQGSSSAASTAQGSFAAPSPPPPTTDLQPSPPKRRRRYQVILSDSDDEYAMAATLFTKSDQFLVLIYLLQRHNTWIASHGEEKNFTLRRMHDPRILWNHVEVPGNRLPKTGSRRILLQAREIPARNGQPSSRLKTQNLPRQQNKHLPRFLPRQVKKT
ncbi:hypothetical protein V6N12_030044 [Hibiscus sabdariffa]|uniref:Uncharacterized protein n=1 Tax=Hibiscus sabdariffa TaxID=183260 RepID=A0ABR2CJ67_9ROSI